MSIHVDRAELRTGDRFTRPLPQLRGKPAPVTYTVTGRATYKGREYLTVHSAMQGHGSIALDSLPEQVQVAR